MVKMHHKNLLTLGLNPAELDHLKQGQPLSIRLDDVGLVGHVIVIIPGESDEALKRAAEEAANKIEAMDTRKLIIPDII
jgi:hypothetical protein